MLDSTIDVTNQNGNTLLESNDDLGLELLFGKEWWASDNWGIGFCAQLIVASMKGKDPDGGDQRSAEHLARNVIVTVIFGDLQLAPPRAAPRERNPRKTGFAA